MGWLHTYGGLIGSAVSSGFLRLMALSNLLILQGIWRRFRRLKQGNGAAPEEPMGGWAYVPPAWQAVPADA